MGRALAAFPPRSIAEKFGISRQAVNRHAKILIEDRALEASGKTSERTYRLAKQEHTLSLLLAENQAEDLVYQTYKDEDLISRSQAKRVLSRFDRFREVMLDFKGMNSCGQAFADEIFRVFKRSHPEVDVMAINTTPQVDQMIRRAQSADSDPALPCGIQPAY